MDLLQELDCYEHTLVPAECQPLTQGCTYGDLPVQPLGPIQSGKYEQNLAPRTGLPQPYGCENLQLPLCTKSDQNTTAIIRHSALGMTSTKLQCNLSIHRRTIAMAAAGLQSWLRSLNPAHQPSYSLSRSTTLLILHQHPMEMSASRANRSNPSIREVSVGPSSLLRSEFGRYGLRIPRSRHVLPQTSINSSVLYSAFTDLEQCTAVSSPEAWSKEKATGGFPRGGLA